MRQAAHHRSVLLRVLPEEAAQEEQVVPVAAVADYISAAVTKGMAVMVVPMALMVSLDMALADLRMVLDKALQPESSAKVLERYMLAAVEEPATTIVLQVPEAPEAAVQVVIFGMPPLELVVQEQQISAEVEAAEAPEVKVVPAS